MSDSYLIIRDINNRVNHIALMNIGFVQNQCCETKNMIIPVLIHCVENSQLFTEEQLYNLTNIINGLNINCV